MDRTSLETFIKITQEESFSRAAEKLHLTQPAISKRIANLEAELDTQLFDRIGKTVQLTRGGAILLLHAKQLLESMHDCKTAIQNLSGKVEGTLKLGVSHHIGLHRLPPYLKLYSQTFPKVQLKIHFIDSEQAYPLLHNGDLEIALTTLGQHPHEHTHQETIWKDPLSFVVSDNHALATLNQNRLLELADLAQFPAILPGNNTYTGQLIQKLFAREQQNINYHIETNYLETIKMMVSIGLGWAVLPRTMLNKELRALHINTENLSRNLGYITHNTRARSNASNALIKTLKGQTSQ